MNLLVKTLLLLSLYGIAPINPALACSCAPPPAPSQARDNATAVFSGKASKVETSETQKKVTIKVDKVWKGEVFETTLVTTCSNGACCGYGFTEGESYLIYAYKAEHHTDYRVTLCSRTTRLADAKSDLQELGEGKAPQKKE